MSLDAKIDDLYRQPLDTFTESRNALAKTLSGADAKRVRALAKPTVVPWAVNQVYWQARPAYDKVIKSGERLRAAQIASLEGRRGADVREAGETHRRALADAVKEAERLAASSGAKPPADALMRTFETLSLASGSTEPPGRLTKPLQPSGFEALAGVEVKARPEGHRGGAEKDRGSAGPRVGTGRTHRSAPATDPQNPTLENNTADVKYETDFRSVYAKVIDNWLGGDSVGVLGGNFKKSGLEFV